MKYYKLIYANGEEIIVSAKTDLELIRKYDLATKENTKTRIIQYEKDQLAATCEALKIRVSQ